MWCGNQGACCHKTWMTMHHDIQTFGVGANVAVKLPGWENQFLGTITNVTGGDARSVSYDIEFLSKEFDVNQKRLMELKQKEHQQMSATAEIIPEARAEVGDLLLARKPLLASECRALNKLKRDFISFVCIVTKTFGKGLQRRHLVRIVSLESDNSGSKMLETEKYYKKPFELEVDASEIEYIFHSYPRLTWWDKKENEPMYLCFQINFRRCLNVVRTLFFIASMFVLFGAALWCILGVFIFPEKFAPYSTAIFTTALNVKVLYGQSVAKLKELESRLIEGVKNMRLVTAIAQLRRHAADFGTSDRGEAAGKQQTKVRDIHKRMVNFLKNPSEAGLSDADLFDDATFVTLRDSGEFKDLENLKDKLDNFKTLFQANIDTDKDSIIPESVRYQIMREHGLTLRNAILMVMLSTFVLVVVFAFLILGLTLFAEGDAFSSAISSLLGATAGVANIASNSGDDDSKLNRLTRKLLETWSSYSQNDTGVSLNDDLRDAVVRRSKYIQQQEKAVRAEGSDNFGVMQAMGKVVNEGKKMVNEGTKVVNHTIAEVQNEAQDLVGGVQQKLDERLTDELEQVVVRPVKEAVQQVRNAVETVENNVNSVRDDFS